MCKRNLYLILLIFCMIAGCQSALFNTIHENKATEQRIIQKEKELDDLNTQNQRFVQKRESLLREKKKLEADLELEKKKLAAMDADLKSLENKGRNKKNAVSAQIRKYNKDIKALKSSVREKEKQLEHLKKESELYLEMGLEE